MKSILPAAMALIAASAAFAGDPSARVSCGAPDGEPDMTVAAPAAVADSLVIDKASMTLSVFGFGGTRISVFDAATGRLPGDKVGEGDMRTPEGRFFISEIVDASEWTHDFGDGLGEIEGCYGPWFMRLDTPGHTGIGIHGTHLPASIGHRASEGCIRLLNHHCDSLRHMVAIGTPVSIYPGRPDREVNEIISAERARIGADSLLTLSAPQP